MHRDARGAGADDHHRDVLGALVDDAQRVEEGGEHHHRGAVLVVVEDRDVELLAQPALDLEAARRGDVLEVDAAEARRDGLDRAHDLVDVLRREAERERVDAAELLEQHRLALHHGHGRLGADVAEAEHGGAVRHDGDRVALDRERPGALGRLVDRHADPRDARRVGHREIVARAHRRLRGDLDLAAEVQQEGAVGDALDVDARQRAHRVDDALAVLESPALTVMSRTVPSRPARTRSIAPRSPPASPIAAATRAKLPGAEGTTTRIVRLYEAEGVDMPGV